MVYFYKGKILIIGIREMAQWLRTWKVMKFLRYEKIEGIWESFSKRCRRNPAILGYKKEWQLLPILYSNVELCAMCNEVEGLPQYILKFSCLQNLKLWFKAPIKYCYFEN